MRIHSPLNILLHLQLLCAQRSEKLRFSWRVEVAENNRKLLTRDFTTLINSKCCSICPTTFGNTLNGEFLGTPIWGIRQVRLGVVPIEWMPNHDFLKHLNTNFDTICHRLVRVQWEICMHYVVVGQVRGSEVAPTKAHTRLLRLNTKLWSYAQSLDC